MTNYMPGYRLHAYASRCGQFDGSEALQALRDSLAYIPPPEKPQMKPMRGNPLPFHSWAVIAGLATIAGFITASLLGG